MSRLGKIFGSCSLLVCLLALASCNTPPSIGSTPEITFQHLQPLALQVRSIEVVRAYQAPGQLPHVEHQLAQPPAEVAARWAQDRLRPVGASRQLRYVIRQASVLEVPLNIAEGIQGALKVEQSERYDALVRVEIEILSETGRVEATAFAQAERSITVPEDISLSERERTWFRLTDDVMKDLDQQLEQTLRERLGRYLVS